MVTPYSSVLGPNDIRLLTVTGKQGQHVCCELTKVSHRDAVYDALSYSWGQAERTADIVCNGVMVKVTPSLSLALDHLMIYQHRSQRPLWIDAICLDQDNAAEKEEQVPRMFEVYDRAKDVIVWLGEAADNSDDVFDRMDHFRSQFVSFRQSGQYGFPCPEDRFWLDLGRLLHRPWFGRLWTLQEAVLAKRKLVMCGLKYIEWTYLTDFLQLTSGGGCREIINQESIRDPFRVNAFVSIGHINSIAQLRRTASQGSYMLAILSLARFRQCLLDLDYVYAILGMLPLAIRTDISTSGLVDYQLNARELFTKIARRYLLTPDIGLHLLSLASASTTKRHAVPSWCPDWATRPSCARYYSEVPSYNAGVISNADQATGGLTAGTEGNQLYIHGFKIDTVKRVGIPWHPSGGDGAVTEDDEQRLRDWEKSCRDVAEEVIESSEPSKAFIRTMIGNVTGAHPVVCMEDFSAEYAYFRHLLHECSDEPCQHIKRNEARYNLFCASLGQNCTGRTFFSTDAHRIGMGPAGIREGDLVYLLAGGRSLYVLRQASSPQNPHNNGDMVYELVGEAYVDGLMEGQAFASDTRGVDEKCCIV